MTPTQLAMVDIDKCDKDPKEIWQRLFELKGNEWICDNIDNCYKVSVQESEGNIATYERD